MNELEIKQLIDKNKELLEEKSELELQKYNLKFEIEELDEKLRESANQNEKYNDQKEMSVRQLITNYIQFFLIALSSIVAGKLMFGVLSKEFVIFVVTANILTNVIVTLATKSDIKDHKKMLGEENFDKEYLNNIEEAKKAKLEQLNKIMRRIKINDKKLDIIYKTSVQESVITSPSNNEYSNDETVKIKQKKIEK